MLKIVTKVAVWLQEAIVWLRMMQEALTVARQHMSDPSTRIRAARTVNDAVANEVMSRAYEKTNGEVALRGDF